jgi:hypothetical protein
MPLHSKHKSRVITAHGLMATISAPDGVTGIQTKKNPDTEWLAGRDGVNQQEA